SAGTAFAATQIARTRRAVTSLPGVHAWMSASSLSVVATTCAWAAAMTRAMLRRTPLSCSGWPLALTVGGWVRMGRPEAESAVRSPAARAAAGAGAGAAGAGAAARVAPAGALPSAAARFTSAMVTVPSGPVPRTRVMSTFSLRACARTAGMARTPPTATACSVWTASEVCMAPTTVPLSARSPAGLGAGAPSSSIAPPSSEATTRSSGAGSWLPTPWPPPWWWPVSWPSARCGRLGSISNSASIAPVMITSPGPPASLSTLPETGEGTSTTALAVSIDTRFSSRRTVSPTLTNHSTMVASGRPSPRSGRWKVFLSAMVSSGIRCSSERFAYVSWWRTPASAGGHRPLRRGDDLLDAGQVLHFQPEQRDVGVVAGDALDRRQQVVHAFLGQARGDLAAEAGGLGRLVHDHAAAGLGHRLGDGVEVQRRQRGDVDDLGA